MEPETTTYAPALQERADMLAALHKRQEEMEEMKRTIQAQLQQLTTQHQGLTEEFVSLTTGIPVLPQTQEAAVEAELDTTEQELHSILDRFVTQDEEDK
jgi:hypothetical protein